MGVLESGAAGQPGARARTRLPALRGFSAHYPDSARVLASARLSSATTPDRHRVSKTLSAFPQDLAAEVKFPRSGVYFPFISHPHGTLCPSESSLEGSSFERDEQNLQESSFPWGQLDPLPPLPLSLPAALLSRASAASGPDTTYRPSACRVFQAEDHHPQPPPPAPPSVADCRGSWFLAESWWLFTQFPGLIGSLGPPTPTPLPGPNAEPARSERAGWGVPGPLGSWAPRAVCVPLRVCLGKRGAGRGPGDSGRPTVGPRTG